MALQFMRKIYKMKLEVDRYTGICDTDICDTHTLVYHPHPLLLICHTHAYFAVLDLVEMFQSQL